MSNQEKTEKPVSKQSRTSQNEIPIYALRYTLKVAQAIWDNFAGKGGAPHQIAMAIDVSPTSGGWRNLCGSSIAYGLTEGGYNANEITLTDIGRRIVAPTEEGDDVSARAEAALRPRIAGEFFKRYDKAKFPKTEIGQNVLVSMGLPKERAVSAFALLAENGTFVGIIQDTKTGPFVAIGTPKPQAVTRDEEETEIETQNDALVSDEEQYVPPVSQAPMPTPDSTSPKQLFVAHGKKHKPLEDLKKILNEFKIPYKIAIDEANRGRPISAKVAELMNECSAGIFIFTKDEKFFVDGKDGHEEIWRPSENVVYELGAASIMWERKIIIVREDGVNFPSDFSDLGYITFKDGEISSKALDILKELVALGLVKFSAA